VVTRRRKGPGGARPGAGRPPLGPLAASESVTVKFTPHKLATITAAAVSAGLTRSAWIQSAIDAALVRC